MKMLRINMKLQKLVRFHGGRTFGRSTLRSTYQTTQKTESTLSKEPEQVASIPDVATTPSIPAQLPATPSPPKTIKMAMPAPMSIPMADSSSAVLDVAKQQEEKLRLATNFDEMPGPALLKYLARAWSYLPRISNQFTAGAMMYFMNMLGATLVWNRGTTPFIHMFDKYGPVVRLQGIFGGDIVFVGRPDHIETVFRQEGKYPLRSSLDSLEKYRVQYRRQSVSGLFITSGSEWEHLRSKIEIPFVQSVNQYAGPLDAIADEFVANLRTILNRQDEVPENFDQEIFKWSLECAALVCLGQRMGCLGGSSQAAAGADGEALLEAMQKASTALRRCEAGFQIWRLVETPTWRTLKNACETIDSIVLKEVRKVEARLQVEKLIPADEEMRSVCGERREPDSQGAGAAAPLLAWLLAGGALRPEDVMTVLLDALLVGTNACAHALAFLLYHLARSPRAQRTLYQELEPAMPAASAEADPSTADDEEPVLVHQLPFLRACLRESLRLNPPIPVLTRVLPADISLHNYRVPKGTLVLMASHVAGLREEHFEDAKRFKPERWLHVDRDQHPFATTPFGSGPRACVAQHLAEMQLCLLTAKIIRNFKVEYNYGSMYPTNRLIAMPNKPLKFRFIERNL